MGTDLYTLINDTVGNGRQDAAAVADGAMTIADHRSDGCFVGLCFVCVSCSWVPLELVEHVFNMINDFL